ncbi:EAL domain-containing protein [Asaia bogorensis]|uniref:EAL domain-containing protein n=1 Tax=Asaia bogorensis TaxID=91915 RepID=UPI0013CEA633|nr:EAL domain-containing protein [Asaia bogorensis]
MGAPVLRWIGRYGRTGDHVRLIGWDVVPLVQPRTRQKARDRDDVTRSDIATLREICHRMSPVGGHYRVSLALSDHTLPDKSFVLALKEVFAETRFSPQALRLVLDERRFSLVGREEARCLSALVEWGVELWVGRFGQGVSSLSLLRERAGSGLIAGVSLEAGLVSAPSGLWRMAPQKQERLDPVAAKFFSATCGALQAIGIRTHFARIASSAQYGFALGAAFDEMSGFCPELEDIAMEATPPCA